MRDLPRDIRDLQMPWTPLLRAKKREAELHRPLSAPFNRHEENRNEGKQENNGAYFLDVHRKPFFRSAEERTVSQIAARMIIATTAKASACLTVKTGEISDTRSQVVPPASAFVKWEALFTSEIFITSPVELPTFLTRTCKPKQLCPFSRKASSATGPLYFMICARLPGDDIFATSLYSPGTWSSMVCCETLAMLECVFWTSYMVGALYPQPKMIF